MADIIQWDFDEYALSISMKDVMIHQLNLMLWFFWC